jgi:hypothetical protein
VELPAAVIACQGEFFADGEYEGRPIYRQESEQKAACWIWFLPEDRWFVGSEEGFGTDEGFILIKSDANAAENILAGSKWFYAHNRTMIAANGTTLVVRQLHSWQCEQCSSKNPHTQAECDTCDVVLSIEQWLALISPDLKKFGQDFAHRGCKGMQELVGMDAQDFQMICEYSNMPIRCRRQIDEALRLLQKPGQKPGVVDIKGSGTAVLRAVDLTATAEGEQEQEEEEWEGDKKEVEEKNEEAEEVLGGDKYEVEEKKAEQEDDDEEEEQQQQQQQQQQEEEDDEGGEVDTECIVCFEEGLKLFQFEPCGHAQVCPDCISGWRRASASKEAGHTSCPTCRKPIENLPRDTAPAWKIPAPPPNAGRSDGVGGSVSGTGAAGGSSRGSARSSLVRWNCAQCHAQGNGDWR